MGIIYDQATGGEQLSSNGKKLRTLVTKGAYADQLAAANARPRGTFITGYGYVLSWNLNRVPGNNGVCTYQLAAQNAAEWENNSELSDVTALKYMRMEIPVERYGGPSEGANAKLYDLARWQTEPNRTLYVAYQYETELHAIITLDARTQLLAKKIQLGHEVVVRHFPVVIRTRTYANPPAAGIGASIDYIETPPAYSSAAPAWLKTQDDIAEGADGIFSRVESWQGAEYWDLNFYGSGAQRWVFGSI
jgi:hypothetical protein